MNQSSVCDSDPSVQQSLMIKSEMLTNHEDLNGIRTPSTQELQLRKPKSETKKGDRVGWKVVDILEMRKNYLGAKEYLVRWQKSKSQCHSYHAWEAESDLKCKAMIRKFHSFKL